MTYIIEERHVGNLTVHVTHDEEPQNPVERNTEIQLILGGPLKSHTSEWAKENLFGLDEAVSWEEIRRLVENQFPGSVIQTVYFYSRGSLALSTTSFEGRVPGGHYEFDCGQAGLVFSTRPQMRTFYDTKRVTKNVREFFTRHQSELVDWFSAYVNGSVYQYEVLREDAEVGCIDDGTPFVEQSYECLDACGGFYDLRQALDAGVEVAERLNEEAAASVPA